MSLAVQTHQRPEKFDVDRAQFAEIIAPRNERVAMSKQRETEKGSGSETLSNKENDKSPRKDSKDYYSSEEDSYDDDFESDAGESFRKSEAKNTARRSPIPKRNLVRTSEKFRTKSPTFVSTHSSKKGKGKKRFKPYISPRSTSPGILVTYCLDKHNETTSRWIEDVHILKIRVLLWSKPIARYRLFLLFDNLSFNTLYKSVRICVHYGVFIIVGLSVRSLSRVCYVRSVF